MRNGTATEIVSAAAKTTAGTTTSEGQTCSNGSCLLRSPLLLLSPLLLVRLPQLLVPQVPKVAAAGAAAAAAAAALPLLPLLLPLPWVSPCSCCCCHYCCCRRCCCCRCSGCRCCRLPLLLLLPLLLPKPLPLPLPPLLLARLLPLRRCCCCCCCCSCWCLCCHSATAAAVAAAAAAAAAVDRGKPCTQTMCHCIATNNIHTAQALPPENACVPPDNATSISRWQNYVFRCQPQACSACLRWMQMPGTRLNLKGNPADGKSHTPPTDSLRPSVKATCRSRQQEM